MKQVEVQIMGQGYVLGCPEGSEAKLKEAVQAVDQAMCGIRDAGKIKARDRIAHQQGLFVPVALHELGWRKATQQGQGLVDVHGETIVPWTSKNNAWSR